MLFVDRPTSWPTVCNGSIGVKNLRLIAGGALEVRDALHRWPVVRPVQLHYAATKSTAPVQIPATPPHPTSLE